MVSLRRFLTQCVLYERVVKMSVFRSFSMKARFEDLCHSVNYCTLCPRLEEKKKILSKENGNIFSKVMFVAEAPGRLGADITGIPLFGDKTGENFETLIKCINWNREDIFITNAILCNPQNENRTNSTPTSEEIANCSTYLGMQIELVRPDVVVSLGVVALRALSLIHPHSYLLGGDVGKLLHWAGRRLVPLYHPGPRVHTYRSFAEQVSDYRKLISYVHPKNGILVNDDQEECLYSDFQRLIYTIVETVGQMSYFKLTKLLYLTDLCALQKLGKTLTREIYIRQEEGPWPPALWESIQPIKERELTVFSRGGKPFVDKGPSPRLCIDHKNDELSVIDSVLDRYGQLSDRDIKTAVYMTQPMRHILRQEKQEGHPLLNKPVIYRDKTAPEIDTGS
jgi:uracil-DNA glycosylase family 4